MPRFRYVLEFEEINCPVCVNHMLPRWICNSQLRIGERIVPIEIHGGGEVSTIPVKYFKEYVVPISLTFEKRVFMNREVWKPILFTLGSYDDKADYYFKRVKLKITQP